jgi:hypothetical protein
LSLRDLFDRYLKDTRSLRGKRTAREYRSRLVPIIEFAETEQARRRWPLAVNIDREFAVELRAYLFQRRVARNGHPNAATRAMSPRQVFNVMDCFRSAVNWARLGIDCAHGRSRWHGRQLAAER